MASSFFVAFAALASSCLLLLHSRSVSGWLDSGATWYYLREGAGTDGGACGYQGDVEKPPFSSIVTAGGPPLFKDGKGCGACYQGAPSTPRGKTFGAMAKPGQADNLRDAGNIRIQYDRVPCKWRGLDIAFRVKAGSNPNYLAVLIDQESGDGDLSAVELQHRGGSWAPMQEFLGAVWKYSSGSTLQAPISIRLTSSSGKKLVASNVIPSSWQADRTYRSIVNY
uniref:Uncharacterized protein n=1 Tax=Aegilops tauschii TaxID=37682 RepID=N1QTE2_AEGTA